MKHLSLAIFTAMLFFSTDATALTEEECTADYEAQIEEVERNREVSLAELNQELRYTSDDEAAAAINHQIEQTWQMEEEFRSFAAVAYRDCVNYVKKSGS